MSIERMSGQGYAPIPQSISNTDTEEEDERLAVPIDNGHEDSEKIRSATTAQGNGWCHSTNDGKNFGKDSGDSQVGYRYCGDEIPIMIPEMEVQNDFWKRREMSTLRRFCLALSIILCFATLLIFLYALPCDNASICPQVIENQPVITWDKSLKGVEIHGPISIVHGNPYSLIFLLKGQRFGVNVSSPSTTREISPDGGGILSMQGNTGVTLWWIPLKIIPNDIDCLTFDSDGSETPDCIVTGKNLLISVDPTSGTIHWTSSAVTNSRLPLLVPDIDSDGIDDMLSVAHHGSTDGDILLLSGKSGKILGEYTNVECIDDSIRLNRLESNYDISYSCEEEKSIKQTVNLTVSLNELLRSNVSHLPEVRSNYVSNGNAISQISPSYNENMNDYAIQLTQYYELRVQNTGFCPGENCHVNVSLTLQKIGEPKRLMWEHSSNNSYAMQPAVYPIIGKPHVTGVAIKFWQWNDDKDAPLDETNAIVKRRLTERVQMVFVNYTVYSVNVHVINASQSEIVQICKRNDCQPSLKLQASSIAIADLGDDGTRELINYQSSYDPDDPSIFTSRVQIVKLDTVLSQLTQTSLN